MEHFAHLFPYSKANHGLAITAILTAGMSMGTVIATFIVFNLLLLRPLPYVESERLVRITRVEPGSGWNVTPDIYDYWRNHNRVFDDMATYRCGEMNWTDVMSSDVLRTCYTTPSFFRVLGLARQSKRLSVNSFFSRDRATVFHS
jgi:putative ABC transport system permease protein